MSATAETRVTANARSGDTRWRAGSTGVLAGLVLGVLLVVGVAGCGGDGGGEGVASAGGTASASSSPGAGEGSVRDAMLKYAQCMRDNGVPEFADPDVGEDGDVTFDLPEGVDKAKVDAAQAKCKQYMPNGGESMKMDPEKTEQLRKYSKCMRDNGVPDFPDPTDKGLQIDGSKINPNDPKVKAASEACSKYQPGGPSTSQTGSNG